MKFTNTTWTAPAELDEYCRKTDFVFNLAGVNRPKDPAEFKAGNFGFASIWLDTPKGKEHPCEFGGVNTVLTENGRYRAASVMHRATLGYIVECLHRFHDQPQTLVNPGIPDGSFTELLKAEKSGQVSANKAALAQHHQPIRYRPIWSR